MDIVSQFSDRHCNLAKFFSFIVVTIVKITLVSSMLYCSKIYRSKKYSQERSILRGKEKLSQLMMKCHPLYNKLLFTVPSTVYPCCVGGKERIASLILLHHALDYVLTEQIANPFLARPRRTKRPSGPSHPGVIRLFLPKAW